MGSRGYPSTYGGFETFVRHLAPWLAQRGHDVTVYCRTRPSGAGLSWDVDGVRCRWTPGLEKKSMSTATYGASELLDASMRRFDVVLGVNIALGPFLPVLRLSGTPVVLNVDGVEWRRGKWGPKAQRAFLFGARMSSRFADRLVCDSCALVEIWREMFGTESDFIPYGAPVLHRPDQRRLEQLNIKQGEFVLAVARLTPENNVDLALDAMARLDWPVDMVVVGAANYDAPVAHRLRRLHADGRVLWLGHLADQELLGDLWSACAVYVHGHSVGGTNPALLQAMGAGAPVLALDTPFNREVVEYDDQLFPHDANELSRRIRRLCDDRELSAELGSRGKEIVADRYRWDDVCQAYLSLLTSVAAHCRRR